AAVAHQPHHLALRVGNRGGAGDRLGLTHIPAQGVNFYKRTVRPDKAPTPNPAGHGDIAQKKNDFTKGFLYVVVKTEKNKKKKNNNTKKKKKKS
ncbi:hypothetical protein ACVGXN_10005, partial [Enterobacter hormaechei]